MKIAILGAMEDEVKTLKDAMDGVTTKTIAGRDYFTGKLHGVETTVVFSRWGKVASSSTATTLINVFGVELIIFTGVAGAVSPKLNIGDIVLAGGLYQHDMDARPIFKRHQIPLTDITLFRPDSKWLEVAFKAIESFLGHLNDSVTAKVQEKFSIKEPKLYRGIVASGDQFVTDALNHDSLKLDGEEVLAVEMEGAAVAQVCHEYKIPYLVIRTISDKADHSATIDFLSFIKEVATHYSAGIVDEFCAAL